jgi:nicotinate-nucleotide pyrophosphorylase (carboxylating)
MNQPFPFSPATDELITLALREDLYAGDVTTDSIFGPEHRSTAWFVARERIVVAGIPLLERIAEHVDDGLDWTWEAGDGDRMEAGVIGSVEGSTRSILRAERIWLNFLRHLCGIATITRRYADALGPDGPMILDTRKTTPGFRELEKYAVRCGGGRNHRFNLGSGAMIKDNHIAAAGSIRDAVAKVRESLAWLTKIEVEVDELEQLEEAIDAGADVILLDNMDDDELRQAVDIADGRVHLEASGTITLERLPQLRDIGIHAVSAGALTHSAPNVDISLKLGARPDSPNE